MTPLPRNSRTRGIMRAYCGARSATGRIPTSVRSSRTVMIERFLPSDKYFHHDDSHSWVRNTQFAELDSNKLFHSLRSCENSSSVSIVSTIMGLLATVLLYGQR